MNTQYHHTTVKRARYVKSGNRRVEKRREVKCNLAVIPVRLDQTPGEVCWLDGFSIDVSGTGIGLIAQRSEPFPVSQLVIGASIAGEPRQFATVTVQYQQVGDGILKIGGCWIKDPSDDLLSERNLSPRIDAINLRFRYGCDEDVLQKWEALGVLRKFLVDRVLVCPGCGSLPTWRNACPKCRSARYSRDRLIHHFACAHVERAASFQTAGDTLQCPKCRAKRLIAGTDFEYIEGPLNCFDCHHGGGLPTLSCMCHRCLDRFDPEDTATQELYGYHVDRLDVLDLLATSE